MELTNKGKVFYIFSMLLRIFIRPLIAMYIWNMVLVELVPIKDITYWQMFFIIMLSNYLFKARKKNLFDKITDKIDYKKAVNKYTETVG